MTGRTADTRVLIIGGGIMGVSLAYHLTARGWRDVVLLEQHELTAGSTWHAAGLCTHFAHHPTIMAMRAASVRLYRDVLPAETGETTGFHPCGALRVTRSAERMAEFRHVQGLGQFVGHEFRILDPEALARIYPLVRTDGLLGAIHEPDDGHVDPTLATRALAAGARSRGAGVRRHERVRAVERDASGAWVVHTDHDTVRCVHVVNAAGTWCREIGAMMGVDLPVVPILHQYLVTAEVPEITARIDAGEPELPIIRDPEESWYLRQERDGFIVGPYEANGRPWGVDGVPDGFGMELLPPELDRVEAIVAMTMERVPVLAQAGIKTIVNGPITFTPDASPLVGPAFGLDNAWLLTGSSMGVMEGGGAGRFLADWMVDGVPPMDALAIDPRRFGGYAGDRDYRVAKAVECFGLQFGVHYPFEERPAGRPRRVTPIYEAQAAQGAVFGCAYGWERPNWFARGVEPWNASRNESPNESRSESRPGSQPESRPEARNEPRPELRSKSRPELQSELRSESRPEARNEPRPELRSKSRPELQPELRSELRPESQPESRLETRPVRPDPRNEPHDAALTFGRPAWHETVAAECRAVRDRAGLVDLSAFSKFEITGADAPAFVERLGANRPPRAIGRIGLTHALTEAGGVASELTVTRLAAHRYYLTSAAAAERHDEDLLRRHAASFADADVVNRTEDLGVLGLMGPEARTVLGALTDSDLDAAAFPWLSARTVRVGTVEARALRVCYAGECGWELHVALADLPTLHDTLYAAGATVGLRPFGAYAMNSMRLEKGYRAWGADLTTERTPLEAGLGHLVRTEGREFAGREALLARAGSPSAWRMALLSIEPDGDADPFYTHTVWRGGRAIGIVTSAAPGHRTGLALALAYLRPEAGAEAGGSQRCGVGGGSSGPLAAGMGESDGPLATGAGGNDGAPAADGNGSAPEAGRNGGDGALVPGRSSGDRALVAGGNGGDNALEVSILGRRRPARVLAEPPYDPANARLRGAPIVTADVPGHTKAARQDA